MTVDDRLTALERHVDVLERRIADMVDGDQERLDAIEAGVDGLRGLVSTFLRH